MFKGPVRLTLTSISVLVLVLSGCQGPSYEKLLRAANSCGARQDYECAIEQATNAIRKNPTRPEAYYALGLAFLGTGSDQSAASQFSRAIGLNPRFAEARLSLSEMMATSSDPNVLQEAREHAQKVLADRPKNQRAIRVLARIEWELDHPAESERLLRAALASDPNDLAAAVALAKLLLSTGKHNEAESVMRAVAHPLASNESRIALAEFYAALNRADEARQVLASLSSTVQTDPAILAASAELIPDTNVSEKEKIYAQLAATGRPDLRAAHALYLLDGGKLDQAIGELENLHKKYPDDANIRTMLVASWLDAGRVQSAEGLLNRVLGARPADMDANLQRSALLIETGKTTEAQFALARVQQLRPDSGMAFYLLAQSMLARRQFKTYRLQLDEAILRDSFLLPARVDLALELTRVGTEHAALAIMEATPRPLRSSPAFHTYTGWMSLATGDFPRAGAHVRSLAKSGKPTAEAALMACVYAIAQRRPNAAVAAATMAVEEKPDDSRSLAILARAAALDGGDAEVGKLLASVAAQHAELPQPLEVLADFHLARGRTVEASQLYLQASLKGPKAIRAKLQLARDALANKQYNVARPFVEEVRRAEPNNVSARMLEAMLDKASGDFTKAADDYKALLDLDPENWVASNNLAYLLSERLGKPDEALKYAEAAVELRPFHAELEDTLGWIYYRKGLFDPAVSKLRSAVSSQGTARQRYHFAMALCRAGDTGAAVVEYRRAMDIDASAPEAQQTLQLLAAAQAVHED